MELTLADGTSAQALLFASDRMSIIAAKAFPPGAPVVMHFAHPELARELRGKSRRSVRRDDGSFQVFLKVLDLRRSERELFAATLPSDGV